MAEFIANNTILDPLLTMYDKVMVLKLYIDSTDPDLYKKYSDAVMHHNANLFNKPDQINAGFDLFSPNEDEVLDDEVLVSTYKLDLQVCCSAKMVTPTKEYNTGYYMYPRSSLSKTGLRLENSVGIIDSGYRGHLIGMFDQIYTPHIGLKYDRYLQICAPELVPIVVELVNSMNELGQPTDRGAGGFGSTGR